MKTRPCFCPSFYLSSRATKSPGSELVNAAREISVSGDRRWRSWCGTLILLTGFAWCPLAARGATLSVPSASYPTVQAAYSNAVSGDTIEIQPGLYLEVPPTLFTGSKQVFFVPAGGRAIVAPNTPPTNDEFTNAFLLSGSSPIAYGANYAATMNLWDPLPASAQSVPAHFGRSVWWSWTAPSNGLVVATTFGSDFSAVLDVFEATGGGPALLPAWDREWYRPNELGFQAYAGTAYAILTGGDMADYGEITLQLSYIAPPPNDNFTNAFVIPEDGGVIAGTSLGATHEPPWEPGHAGSPASNSVWFRWTAPLSNNVAPYPVKISTVGSDFDTALAVYTNGPPGQLALVAANDNRATNAFDSRVSFTVVPGAVYYLAVDGGATATTLRDRFGNYLLRLDPSLVDLRVPTNPPVIDPQTRTATFSGQLDVRNYGLAATAPLQVRLVARAAPDLPGIHRAPVAETNLLTLSIDTGLHPNEARAFFFTVTCPAPQVTAQKTNLWGVFALLDEEFGGGQVVIDLDFLGYGDLPETSPPILSWGPGRPLPPALAASEVNDVGAYGLEGPPWVTERSINQFFFLVQLSSGPTTSQTNGTWSASPLPAGVSIDASGLLKVNLLAGSTSLTLSGSFSLGGRYFPQRSAVLSLYKQPRLSASRAPGQGAVFLRVDDDTGLTYSLESNSTLTSTNWQFVQTVKVANPNSPPVITLPAGPAGRNFFRLRATP